MHGLDRQHMASKQQTTQLDFGKASVEGYKPYTGGHVLDVTALLLSCEQVGIVTGAGRFFSQEQQRQTEFQSSLLTTDDLAAKAVLSDPIEDTHWLRNNGRSKGRR